MKKVLGVHDAPPMHWVGDGFPVRSMFSYDGLGQRLSPFLLLDHAAPMDFPPSPRPRGVGWHPHRGFETVTIVYQGEVAHRDSTGPARTFTRMDVWDLRLSAGGSATLATPPGHTLALAVLRGTVQVNGDAVARAGQLVVLSREGEGAVIEANNEAVVLWLAGEPINEPVVGYGPFVMNSQAEIRQAIEDFNSGRFGRMQDGGSH